MMHITKLLHHPTTRQFLIGFLLILTAADVVFIVFAKGGFIPVIQDPDIINIATLAGLLLGIIALIASLYYAPVSVPILETPPAPPYTSHLFITYAHADQAWATPLVEYLTAKFPTATLWTDDSSLDINSPQFHAKLQDTAIFLVIWSDAYCDSRRCSKQLNLLLNHVKADRGRLFVVERESKEYPKSLEGSNRYHFGNVALDKLPKENPPELAPFVNPLVDGMTSKLQALRMIALPPSPQPVSVPMPVPVAKKPSPRVLVNAYKGDESLADKIIKILDKQYQFKSFGLTYQGRPKEVRERRERLMQECHAMVVVYGSTNNDWVQDQCLDFATKHSQTEAPIAICETPKEMPVLIGGHRKFDCHDQTLENKVCDFLKEVKSYAI